MLKFLSGEEWITSIDLALKIFLIDLCYNGRLLTNFTDMHYCFYYRSFVNILGWELILIILAIFFLSAICINTFIFEVKALSWDSLGCEILRVVGYD